MDTALLSARNLLIDTGNVISCKELKQKPSQSPTEELIESISCTLQSCKESEEFKNNQANGQLVFRNSLLVSPIAPEERKDLKLTVKIFLSTFDSSKLTDAINRVMIELCVSVLDSVIVAFPPAFSGGKLSLQDIQILWGVLEELVTSQKVVTIGVSDLETALLKELYEAAQVKPSVNQVNLESCCVMPPDMTSFAKEKDIQLLTHSDPKVLLNLDSLHKCLSLLGQYLEVHHWTPEWVARYSVFVKCRGIIQTKGYLLAAAVQSS